MTGRRRAIATLLTIAGFVTTAGGITATSAAWTENATFGIQASTATTSTTTTTTTTTLPPTTTTTTTTTVPPTTTTTTTVPPTTTSTTTTTTTTSTTTTTTAPATTTTTTLPPPPPTVWPGGISVVDPKNTVISGIVWDISKPHQVCAEVRITGASSTAQPWQLRMNLAVPPWYFSPTSKVQTNGTATVAVENGTTLLITGQTRGGKFDPRTNNTPLTNLQTAVVSLCNRNAPPPLPAEASWYSIAQVPSVWTDTQACVVVTATSLRTDLTTSPFYFGWVGTVDLRAARDRIIGAFRVPDNVSWSPNPNGNNFTVASTQFSPPQDSYKITSGYDSALRPLGGGADSYSITVCVNGR